MPTASIPLAPTKPGVRPRTASAPLQPGRASRAGSLRDPRLVVEVVLFVVLAAGGGLLLWGSNFLNKMVHDQLSAQKISFPAKGSAALDPKTFPGLQRYAGQAVDNGPKAKAYANEFIAVHITHIAGGKTYAEVSAAAQQNPSDLTLAAQADSLFRGETLRGLLLSVWGWSVVALIASITSSAAFVGAAAVLMAGTYGVFHPGDQR